MKNFITVKSRAILQGIIAAMAPLADFAPCTDSVQSCDDNHTVHTRTYRHASGKYSLETTEHIYNQKPATAGLDSAVLTLQEFGKIYEIEIYAMPHFKSLKKAARAEWNFTDDTAQILEFVNHWRIK